MYSLGNVLHLKKNKNIHIFKKIISLSVMEALGMLVMLHILSKNFKIFLWKYSFNKLIIIGKFLNATLKVTKISTQKSKFHILYTRGTPTNQIGNAVARACAVRIPLAMYVSHIFFEFSAFSSVIRKRLCLVTLL